MKQRRIGLIALVFIVSANLAFANCWVKGAQLGIAWVGAVVGCGTPEPAEPIVCLLALGALAAAEADFLDECGDKPPPPPPPTEPPTSEEDIATAMNFSSAEVAFMNLGGGSGGSSDLYISYGEVGASDLWGGGNWQWE